jgi:phosphoribosylamine--glycine ligase
MGAYSPAPIVDDALQTIIDKEVLDNFLRGIQAENLDFHGIIYAGIMVTRTGIKVLEFNVRFGDPEVQAILMRLKTDFSEVVESVIDERLDELTLEWDKGSAVCVVIASGGYPKSYEKGFEITGIKESEKNGAVVFHAGTSRMDGKIVNTGGRVLGVTAKGDDISSAIENSYAAVEKINWEGCIYRTDIAQKALKRVAK